MGCSDSKAVGNSTFTAALNEKAAASEKDFAVQFVINRIEGEKFDKNVVVKIEFDGTDLTTSEIKPGTDVKFNGFLWCNETRKTNKEVIAVSVGEQGWAGNDNGYFTMSVGEVGTTLETKTVELRSDIPDDDAELGVEKADGDTNFASGKVQGKITFSCVKLTRKQVQNDMFDTVIDVVDPDKDGRLSLEQVDACLEIVRMSDVDQKELRTALEAFDKDHDNTIDKEELRAFFFSEKASNFVDLDEMIQYHAAHLNDESGMLMKRFVPRSDSIGWSIEVKDLETGMLVEENIPMYITIALKAMSANAFGRWTTAAAMKLAHSMSVRQGEKFDNPKSVSEIPKFIELHKLNVDELKQPIEDFKCFNDFFSRELKESARPINEPDNNRKIASPADCRLMVFDNAEEAKRIWIKGKEFTIPNLLNKADIAPKFEGCSMAICRLSPQDYHRWHVPLGGTLGPRTMVDGGLYTVNPIAVREPVDVFTENKRCLMPIETEHFGTVMMIAVGAVMVGSMVFMHDKPEGGETVVKGEQHGYFKFGGSTVIMLFEKGTVKWNQNILDECNKGIEVLVKVGAHIGNRAEVAECKE